MSGLKPARARALLRKMRGGRVLVLGDVMLDEFLWGKVVRISPEAPVPVVEVVGQSFHVGGAGNVAVNVRALGGEAVLAGVVGRDNQGERLLRSLEAAGVQAAVVMTDDGRPTTVKTRIIANNQQVVRADREWSGDIPQDVEDRLLEEVARVLPTCGALVLSDYHKGVLTPRVLKTVLPAARRRKVPVLVDPKLGHFPLYKPVTLVTPNQGETEQATGIRIRTDADLLAAGSKLLKMLGCPAALVTRGEHGMSLFRRDAPAVHIPTAAREVFDVTGAGDTVIASVALAVQAGASLDEAASFANHAAGVVVAKLGTATASPEEILHAIDAE